ncbi:MAG: PQQ-dependent sugar dehydrogenase [Acidimicrobiales bacterium]
MPRPRVSLALVAATVVLSTCGGGDQAPTTPQPSSGVPAPTTGATAPPATATPGSLQSVRVRLTQVADLDAPVALATRPGHDPLYVAERAGRVRVIADGQVAPRPLLDISDQTTTDGERGLLGLAFSPDGGRLYVSYTDNVGDSRLDEYALGPAAADIDLASRRTVVGVDQPFSNHNGGHVAFGPDGLLYYGLGDGGSAGDPGGNGQDPSTLLGSILRIDPRSRGGDPYAIPADNPFAGGGGRGEVFVYGLRNPWRFSFDRATGDLWIGDVGQNEVEEVDLLRAGAIAGANLGWNLLEGSRPFAGSPPPDAVGPVFEYPNRSGGSVIGGFVYRGGRIPGLQGAYVFGDLADATVEALVVEGARVTAQRSLGVGVDPGTLVSFGQDVAGELYVLSLAGPLLRLDPT